MIRSDTKYKIAKETLAYGVVFTIVVMMVVTVFRSMATPAASSQQAPWIGVEAVELNAAIIKKYRIHSPNGLLVSRTFIGSPAEVAGIRKGDIIRKWNGISITSLKQFQKLMSKTMQNQRIKLAVDRDGAQILVFPELGLRPGNF